MSPISDLAAQRLCRPSPPWERSRGGGGPQCHLSLAHHCLPSSCTGWGCPGNNPPIDCKSITSFSLSASLRAGRVARCSLGESRNNRLRHPCARATSHSLARAAMPPPSRKPYALAGDVPGPTPLRHVTRPLSDGARPGCLARCSLVSQEARPKGGTLSGSWPKRESG